MVFCKINVNLFIYLAQIMLVQNFQATWMYIILLKFYDLDLWCIYDDKHFVSC